MSLVQGKDYYIEKGKYVFTAEYLNKRGYCCDCGCRHCPYKNNKTEKPFKSESQKEKGS